MTAKKIGGWIEQNASLWMVLDFIMMYAYFTGIFQIVYWLFNKR